MAKLNFKPFGKSDWENFSGADANPQIAELENVMVGERNFQWLSVVVDDAGMLFNFVGIRDGDNAMVVLDCEMAMEKAQEVLVALAENVVAQPFSKDTFRSKGFDVEECEL